MFETELCTNDDNLIGKMYKMLLNYDIESEQVTECMINWHNIQMEQWENCGRRESNSHYVQVLKKLFIK